jgi:hypothetical protein
MRRRTIPRKRGAFSGFLVLLLGVWAALIAFVGPYFNYQIGTQDTWDWSANRLYLEVLPGVAAALGGLIMMGSIRRMSASFGALLALAGGIWLVIGPTMSMLWEHGQLGTGPAFGSNGVRVLEWLGFFYGAGALITLFSAYTLGFLAALPITGEGVAPAAAYAPRAGRDGPGTDREEAAAPASRDGTAEPAADDREPAAAHAETGRRRRFLRRPLVRRRT